MPAFNTSASSEPSSRNANATSSLTCASLETSQVLAKTFCAGNFLASSSRVARQFFFAAGAQHDVRAFAQEMFGDDFAESLAAAGDERVEIFEFHVRRDRRKDARRRGWFFNSFSKKRLASTKTGWRICRNNFRPVRLAKLRPLGANGNGFRARPMRSEISAASETGI